MNIKKFFILFLFLLLTFTSISFVSIAQENTMIFNDIKKGVWYEDSVYQLVELAIIDGFNDGTFRPNDKIQKDQFIKMLIIAMGYQLEKGDNYWAKPYIEKALELGLMEDGEFPQYNVAMTREQMASVAVNATLKKEFAPTSNIERFIKEDMKDYYDVSNKYKQNVLYSYGLGLIVGYNDKNFKPQGILTRAEASVVIMRYLNESLRNPFVPDIDPKYILEMQDWNFEPITVYPPPKMEVIPTARHLIDIAKLTKGYSDVIYSPNIQEVVATFYENKEKRDFVHANPFDFENNMLEHMFIDINTLDYPQSYTYAYNVHVYDSERTKKLHREVVYEFFKYLLGEDADKVMQKFDIYLEYDVQNSSQEIFTYNSRKVYFYKHSGNDSFEVVITSELD